MPKPRLSEATVQAAVRQRAAVLGIRLERNNVGVCVDSTGRMIRYGLGNDSAQINRRLKSADLIGVLPHYSYPGRVAEQSIGRFLAVECKREGWKFPKEWEDKTPDQIDEDALGADKLRTLAQWRWQHLIRQAGGIAGFVTSVDEFERLIGV
jgi:hypothetical protein